MSAPADPMSRGQSPQHQVVTAIAAAGLALTVAACGDVANASPRWCTAIGELDATIVTVRPDDPDAVIAAFAERGDLGDRIRDAAPDAVADDAARVGAAVNTAASTGTIELLEPDTAAAMAAVHSFAAADCNYERVQVTARGFSFDGFPERLPSGRLAIAFHNADGVEHHELVVFRKDGAVPMTDLLALPEEEAMQRATVVAFTSAPPNGTNGLIVDLPAGEYGVVCFVPTGGEDGPPHFVHGMIADVSVE